ncbi:branched-chain amino acid ABC transporter permease [Neobacillus novalis]|uniref:Branched-chain amino acid ABC transporter permease n=1 Tax=Neobacillus novalis TaxID=220687 RepID=A0AA95MNL7_9BACI|nr:branched-chain amino acid ABC transporter permease [Neobacillus novalis]WHY84003.1 branched-chain amino acid ABC transporter permease [Neobacillus novalis]
MRKASVLRESSGIIVFIIAALLITFFSTNSYYLGIVGLCAISIILTLSLNMLFGLAGQISFGHAGFYALGAYISTIIESKFGISFEWSLIITLVLCFLLSWIIAFPILKLKDHYLGMATLAFGLLIFTISMQWVEVTGGPSGMPVLTPTIFGMDISTVFNEVILVATIVVFIFCTSIYHSKLGIALKAVAADENAAKAAGVDVVRYKTLIFSLSGAMAAFAGILYAHLYLFISPEAFSIHTSIMILTMVVIGGLGSNSGAVIGAIFITLLPEFIEGLDDMKTMIYGVALLIVLLFFPNGLVKIFHSFKPVKVRKVEKEIPHKNLSKTKSNASDLN